MHFSEAAARLSSTRPNSDSEIELEAFGSTVVNISGVLQDQKSRCPDQSFGFTGAHPTVVVEVAFTQPWQKLDNIAKDYIEGTQGAVKVVLVLNLQCNSGSDSDHSTVSLWRVNLSDNGDADAVPTLTAKPVILHQVRSPTAARLLDLLTTDTFPTI